MPRDTCLRLLIQLIMQRTCQSTQPRHLQRQYLQLNNMPISGVRCPTCTASGHEIWVIPGKHCCYCGTPCGGDNHGLSGPNPKAQTASSPKYSHFPHLSFLFPITTAELPPNDSEEKPLRLKSKLLEIVESHMPVSVLTRRNVEHHKETKLKFLGSRSYRSYCESDTSRQSLIYTYADIWKLTKPRSATRVSSTKLLLKSLS